MRNKINNTAGGYSLPPAGRRSLLQLLGLGLLLPLTACDRRKSSARSNIVLNVEMFSYVDRAAFDIFFNDEDLGVMNKYGGTGTIVGVSVPFGVQSLSWRLDGPVGTPRNGETVRVKNTLVIKPEQIAPGTRYLGLHLYPDDTAEITFAEVVPDRTARGEKILSERAQRR